LIRCFLNINTYFQTFFTSKEILCQFSSPIDFESVSADALAQLLTQLSRQKVGAEKAKQLKSAASNSFGITFQRQFFLSTKGFN
jgi:transposase